MKRLFGTSGIRGVVNEELTPHLALQTGLAIATNLNNTGTVTIAHDTRTSSPMLEAALTSGLLCGGCSVLRLGMLPTPALAYLTRVLSTNSGVMVTASHNPPEYNGIKLFNGDSLAYTDKQQSEIQCIIERKSFKRVPWQLLGSSSAAYATDKYVGMILDNVPLSRKWALVLDPGCGATAHVAPTIFRGLGCKVVAINTQPDGFFPGRSPEPTEVSLQNLCEVVKGSGADAGFGYDGDGDRVVMVDERGEMISPDRLLAAYAAHVVRKRGGGTVVTHVDTSMCVDAAVEARGGRVMRTGVGDVNISVGIKAIGAVFGGEPIGAWVHPEYHLCPDGILSSALLLEALEDEDATPSQFVSDVPTFPILREKVDCPNLLKEKVMLTLKDGLPKSFPNYTDVLEQDGIRISVDGGWLLVRPSGTEPILRITVEATSGEEAEQVMGKSLRIVRQAVEEAKR